MNRFMSFATSLLMLILTAGCGTVVTHSGKASYVPAGRYYRGVQFDGQYLSGPVGLLVMFDIPLSFAADTLVIPFDAKDHSGYSPASAPPDIPSSSLLPGSFESRF